MILWIAWSAACVACFFAGLALGVSLGGKK